MMSLNPLAVYKVVGTPAVLAPNSIYLAFNGIGFKLLATTSDLVTPTIKELAAPGSTKQITYNLNGLYSAASNLNIVDNSLQLVTQSDPTSDAVGLSVYSKLLGGIPRLTYKFSTENPKVIQNSLLMSKICSIQAVGNSNTTFTTSGWAAWTFQGAATAVAIASTSRYTLIRKVMILAAVINSLCFARETTNSVVLSDSTLDTSFEYSFEIGDTGQGTVVNPRSFVGLRSAANPTDVNPLTVTNYFGFVRTNVLANINNWYVSMNGSSATGYTLDTGVALSNTEMHRLIITHPPKSNSIGFAIISMTTGLVLFETLIDLATITATQRPALSTLYGASVWFSSSGVITQRPSFAIGKVSLETEL